MKTNNHKRVNENCEKIAHDPEAMAHYITCLEDMIHELYYNRHNISKPDPMIIALYSGISESGYKSSE